MFPSCTWLYNYCIVTLNTLDHRTLEFTRVCVAAPPYQYAVDVVSLQVGSGSLQEPPVATFVVRDVGLHLVVLPLVGDQHAFNSSHLWDAHSR